MLKKEKTNKENFQEKSKKDFKSIFEQLNDLKNYIADYKKWQVNLVKFQLPEMLKKNKNEKVNMEEVEEIQNKIKKELKGVKDIYKIIEEYMNLLNSMIVKLNEEMEILKDNMKNNLINWKKK